MKSCLQGEGINVLCNKVDTYLFQLLTTISLTEIAKKMPQRYGFLTHFIAKTVSSDYLGLAPLPGLFQSAAGEVSKVPIP